MLRTIVAALVLMFAFAFVAMHTGSANATVPAFASVITNQATAQYTDATSVVRNTSSNTVSTTVSQVKSFTLTAPGMKTSPISQQVCYQHVITNTGNGPDTYALNAITTGGAFAHTSMSYRLDNAGTPSGTTTTTSGLISAISPANTFTFWICGTVPASAIDGQVGTMIASVSDTNTPTPTTLTNTDSTTVSSSAVTVTKTLVTTPPSGGIVTTGASPSGQLYVNLHYTVNGSAAATNVALTDVLPAGMNYGALGLARWGLLPMAALTEANDGAEQMSMAGATIDFRQTGALTAATVTATISVVNAGQSGDVWFPVTIASGLAPQTITNNTTFTTTQNPAVTSGGSASYTVLQSASVVANNNTGSSANGAGFNTVDPTSTPASMVALTTASPGQSIFFKNVIWNTGNAVDTFDITLLGAAGCAIGNGAAPACNFPAGTTFQLFQADGVTSLPNPGIFPGSLGNTGNVNAGGSYVVVVKATLPANAPAGNNGGANYHIDKQARSTVDNTKFDNVTDLLPSISSLTVDLTNISSRCDSVPAGTASDGTGVAACTMAGNTTATTGFGPGTMTAITTNMVTPQALTTSTTVFRLYVNNTSLVTDTYALTASAPPAGWGVAFQFDGGMNNCSTLGAVTGTSGAIAAGANKLICAVITVPAASNATAVPGTTNFTFTATNAAMTATDYKLDAVTVNPLHDVVIDAGTSGQTVPGGSLIYTHVITNRGNVTEAITFPGAFLTDSNAPWNALSALYVDTNGNGTYDSGIDLQVTNATSIMMPGASTGMNTRAVFTVVQAPAGSVNGDVDQTTITAKYNAGAGTLTTFDTTTVTDGLLVEKYQASTPCNVTPVTTFSMAGVPSTATMGVTQWTKAAITASAATAPGKCIAYIVVATNKSNMAVTAITLSDTLPSMTPVIVLATGCGAPSATAPGTAPTGPNMNGQTGTIATTAATLGSSSYFALQFCVKINDM